MSSAARSGGARTNEPLPDGHERQFGRGGRLVLALALALLAAATGFCAGCVAYRILARLRGVRHGRIDSVDLAELGAAPGAGASCRETNLDSCL